MESPKVLSAAASAGPLFTLTSNVGDSVTAEVVSANNAPVEAKETPKGVLYADMVFDELLKEFTLNDIFDFKVQIATRFQQKAKELAA